MPRHPRKFRRLIADGHTYLWRQRHSHRLEKGRPTDCRQTLTLHPRPADGGGALRVVFADGPNRYVPGGAPFGSGDVGRLGGGSLNLHEPGAVRALLDAATAHGWCPGAPGGMEIDGWTLLEAAAAAAHARRDDALAGR